MFNLNSVNDLHNKDTSNLLLTMNKEVQLLAENERQLITNFCKVLDEYLHNQVDYDNNGLEPCQLSLQIQTSQDEIAQKFELNGSRLIVCSKDHYNAKYASVLLDFP